MANPVFVDCPANAWTLVAANITSGQLWRANTRPRYYQTYRMAGDPAPVDISEGSTMFVEADNEIISSSDAIDVYIFAKRRDGRVRVDA
ncbi:MAG: hypothetical protein ACWGMZ_05550 [Thermoguttaceae bacterium]